MSTRMHPVAIVRLEEQRSRGPRASEWPLVTDIGPQSAGLGPAGAWRQHRHWSVVDMKDVAAEDVGSEGVDQRLQRRRRGTNPAGQGRGLQADAVTGEISAWR